MLVAGEVPPLCILSFNRPHYLRPVLETLARQVGGLAGRQIHFFQDGAVNAYSGVRYATDEEIGECLRLREELLPESVLHFSEANLGICESFLRAETFAFLTLRAEAAYFFEDDMELSPFFLQVMDLLFASLRTNDRIGYFSAHGHQAATLVEQRARRGDLVQLGHHWAFGLKRLHWLEMQPFMQRYYALVVGRDYRDRPGESIKAAYRESGLSHPASSQDGAKTVATAILNRYRVTDILVFREIHRRHGRALHPGKIFGARLRAHRARSPNRLSVSTSLRQKSSTKRWLRPATGCGSSTTCRPSGAGRVEDIRPATAPPPTDNR